MNKFLVIVSDMDGVPDFIHPSEICGINKNEVFNLVQRDTPSEYIKGVFTPKEYLDFIETDQFRNTLLSYNPNLGQNKNAIINVINSIKNNIMGMINQNTNEIDQQSYTQSQSKLIQTSQPNIPIKQTKQIFPNQSKEKISQIKYFNDDGNQFKLQNGQLYKKVWEDVNLEPYTDQLGNEIIPEIRLISKETGKPTKSSKIGVQKLTWKKLK